MNSDIAMQLSARTEKNFLARHWAALIGSVVAAMLITTRFYLAGGGWIGFDNDDAMRLVGIRDLIAGQGWFDHMQYRLGPEGGSSMHWSRLIDAPLAGLILFFSHFVSMNKAEVAALAVWPLLLIVPVMLAISTGARRLGGDWAVLPALVITAFFLFQFQRFSPGSIDHHNVQLALIAIVFAGLLDRRLSWRSFALSGTAAAGALAIGVEPLPLVGVSCVCVAILWAYEGDLARSAAIGFGIAFATTLAVLFFVTVGPADYAAVHCDAYSIAFFAVGATGACALALAAYLVSGRSTIARFTALGAIGLGSLALAALIAPACLGKPYADIDPKLAELWLDHVTEAQSVIDIATGKPAKLLLYHVLPAYALAVCAWWAWRGERTIQLFTASFIIAAAYAVSLYQVRGAVFAMMASIVVLAVFVGRNRAAIYEEGATLRVNLLYVISGFAAIPLFWMLVGIAVEQLVLPEEMTAQKRESCSNGDALSTLARQPAGLVSSISNLGAHILLYTGHRALSAPYHRNQAGMRASLDISTLPPPEAEKVARDAGVTMIAVCPVDGESKFLVKAAPEGLLAKLTAGEVPEFLEPVEGAPDDNLKLFRLKP